MRRADRLFQIVQMLRGGRVVTAQELAQELEVSLRTVYRDIASLTASGTPITGEAGVGYCLEESFDFPPLMFERGEIDALLLGVQMVQALSDGALARSARSVLSKVESVLPDGLKSRFEDPTLFVPLQLPDTIRKNMEHFRAGLDEQRKVRLKYVDAKGVTTERTIRPLCLAFWGTVWTGTAWCELRDGFRDFRPDRMQEVTLLDEAFEQEPGKDRDTYLRRIREHLGWE